MWSGRLLYPICWGLSEGGNRITNDGESAFYGVLDILSQGVFALGLLWLVRRLDFDQLGLGFSEHGRVAGARDYNIHDEKRMHGGSGAGLNNGTGVHNGSGANNGTAPATTGNTATTTAPAV